MLLIVTFACTSFTPQLPVFHRIVVPTTHTYLVCFHQVLEDTIHLKNIHLPRIKVVDPRVDLSVLQDPPSKKLKFGYVKTISNEDVSDGPTSPHELVKPVASLLAVPSFSTLMSLRKSISDHGNVCPLTQKHLVQLDWVSKEDGSHILTVAVGSKVRVLKTDNSHNTRLLQYRVRNFCLDV